MNTNATGAGEGVHSVAPSLECVNGSQPPRWMPAWNAHHCGSSAQIKGRTHLPCQRLTA